jgi:hypothetical protein
LETVYQVGKIPLTSNTDVGREDEDASPVSVQTELLGLSAFLSTEKDAQHFFTWLPTSLTALPAGLQAMRSKISSKESRYFIIVSNAVQN